MDVQEIIKEVERRGVYATARNLMMQQELMMHPVSVHGIQTRMYGIVPGPKVKGHREVLDAACRLWDEGFFSCLFYPETDKETPCLLVVWDSRIAHLETLQMPCMLCSKEAHQRARCSGCDMLTSWSTLVDISGTFTSAEVNGEDAETSEVPETKLSDQELYSYIPHVHQMRVASQASAGENCDHLDESIYLRVMKRMENWALSHMPMQFPFLSKGISGYVTVAITPREYTDPMFLHKVIVQMEKKGFCCGPIISTSNRPVLFITWDEDLMYYLPAKTPCTSECEGERGDIVNCYCTEFEAWLAKWNNLTRDIRVREQ